MRGARRSLIANDLQLTPKALIMLSGCLFCLAGEFDHGGKKEIEALILRKGGRPSRKVTPNTDFLVLGDESNPCWAFSCYGRHVEMAAQMRQDGRAIQIISESDLRRSIE